MNILLAALLVAAAPAARAAEVYLKDGGVLRGVIESSTPQALLLRTPEGLVSIPAERVARVDDGAAAPAPAPAPAAPRPLRRHWREETEEDRSQLLTLDFGVASPLSDVSLGAAGGGSAGNGDPGPLVGLQYFYYVTPSLALGPGFEYFHRSANGSFSLLPAADSSVSGDTLALMALLRYSFTDEGRARPYFLAGVGPAHNSLSIEATPLPGFVWSDTGTDETRRLVDGGAWTATSTLRLGVDFHTGWSEIFALEAGWTWLSAARYGATPQGRALGLSGVSAPLSAFVMAARWGWRF